MTLYGLLASLAWALIGALFIARLNRFAHRWLDLRSQQRETVIDAKIPDDLMGLALGESEKWAQDAVLETIRERFDKLKDWNKVRQSVGVAEKGG